uniref:Uncharacterized protein n=1 Tax=Rhipicephalus zambeziensis TaxID=60191 RepID=A0A224YGT7_9ACAR
MKCRVRVVGSVQSAAFVVSPSPASLQSIEFSSQLVSSAQGVGRLHLLFTSMRCFGSETKMHPAAVVATHEERYCSRWCPLCQHSHRPEALTAKGLLPWFEDCCGVCYYKYYIWAISSGLLHHFQL